MLLIKRRRRDLSQALEINTFAAPRALSAYRLVSLLIVIPVITRLLKQPTYISPDDHPTDGWLRDVANMVSTTKFDSTLHTLRLHASQALLPGFTRFASVLHRLCIQASQALPPGFTGFASSRERPRRRTTSSLIEDQPERPWIKGEQQIPSLTQLSFLFTQRSQSIVISFLFDLQSCVVILR